MAAYNKPCHFPHRVRATEDIELMDGVIVPTYTLGWLIGFSHLWHEPNVIFDGFGACAVQGKQVQTIRVNGHLERTHDLGSQRAEPAGV